MTEPRTIPTDLFPPEMLADLGIIPAPTRLAVDMAFTVDCPYGTTTYANYPGEPCYCPDCTLDAADDYALEGAGL